MENSIKQISSFINNRWVLIPKHLTFSCKWKLMQFINDGNGINWIPLIHRPIQKSGWFNYQFMPDPFNLF